MEQKIIISQKKSNFIKYLEIIKIEKKEEENKILRFQNYSN